MTEPAHPVIVDHLLNPPTYYGGLNFYQGPRYQRGNGTKAFFRGLHKQAVPFVKEKAKQAVKGVAKAGLQVAKDVVKGSSVKEAVKKQVKKKVDKTVKKVGQFISNKELQQLATKIKRTVAKQKTGKAKAKGKGKGKGKKKKKQSIADFLGV